MKKYVYYQCKVSKFWIIMQKLFVKKNVRRIGCRSTFIDLKNDKDNLTVKNFQQKLLVKWKLIMDSYQN